MEDSHSMLIVTVASFGLLLVAWFLVLFSRTLGKNFREDSKLLSEIEERIERKLRTDVEFFANSGRTARDDLEKRLLAELQLIRIRVETVAQRVHDLSNKAHGNAAQLELLLNKNVTIPPSKEDP